MKYQKEVYVFEVNGSQSDDICVAEHLDDVPESVDSVCVYTKKRVMRRNNSWSSE